jgi:hypothetical protein
MLTMRVFVAFLPLQGDMSESWINRAVDRLAGVSGAMVHVELAFQENVGDPHIIACSIHYGKN